jgi:hypothetical protein
VEVVGPPQRDRRSKPYPVVEDCLGRDRDDVTDTLPFHEEDRATFHGHRFSSMMWSA